MTEANPLPVLAILPALETALDEAGAAVLCAPPGSGKTTAVPPALMDAAWLAGRRVVMLEPRRVAARAAARFMSAQLGEAPGGRIGFRVRFESAVSERTRVEVVTEGVLARRLQRDPELPDVGLVVFDEFHERSLEGDTALALTLDVRRSLRPDLRVLVMSATLDAAPVARLLGNAPVLEAGGRPYPVDLNYQERASSRSAHAAPLAGAVARAVRQRLNEDAGDVLVFLPGAREIRATAEALAAQAQTGLLVVPLYGDLPPEAQDRAIRPDPQGRRRVVLATNIAETSLTIEGVHSVVDSGLARRPRFDPNSGLTRLETVPISRASATQRAGRAGRLGPGHATRLWGQAEHDRRREHDPPEIASADLCALVLELANWGTSNPSELDWLDPPPPGAWNQARDLLRDLDALDDAGRITALGRRMAALPAHPRLARMLCAARSPQESALAADLAALLDGPDPITQRDAGIDLGARVDALQRYRQSSRRSGAGESGRALSRAERIAAQLRRLLRVPAGTRPDSDAAGALLLAGYPDRLARRRASGERGRLRLVTGRGLALDGHDPLADRDWLVVPDLDAGAAQARAFRAATLSEDIVRRVLGDRIQACARVQWNPREQGVDAVQEERLGELVLSSARLDAPDPEAVTDAMLDGVRRLGLEALPWSEDSRDLQARMQSLHHWQPQAGWPAVDDSRLEQTLSSWLGPFLAGITRRDHLARVDLRAALRACIPPPLQARLDEGAPTHLAVPSGNRARLHYRPGEAPRLAVKLQEMFGCDTTPRVCWGQVPVVVELLSPARRPLHLTQDLASFWRNGYPQVRKEMRGRYPKHPWPEDPLAANPTASTRRR